MRAYLIALCILFSLSGCEILEGLINTNTPVSTAKPLTETEVVNGLKEALTVGISNGSEKVSKVDGYFLNPSIKIFFPPEAQKVEKKLRELGFNKEVDNVILTINRGAEDAAKQAKPIFVEAIRNMTIKDAINILKGSDNAATEYLRANTSSQLHVKFKPVIKTSLDKVNATKYWTDAFTIYNKIPFVEKVETDLPEYVTKRALDGLFKMVAEEEAKIRNNPVARVTELLKRVFGYYK